MYLLRCHAHYALNTDFYSPNLYGSVLFICCFDLRKQNEKKKECSFDFPTVQGVVIIAVLTLNQNYDREKNKIFKNIGE